MTAEQTTPAPDFDPEMFLARLAATEEAARARQAEYNALPAVERDALPPWVWRFLFGAGDGRTAVSLERSGERSSRGPGDEYVIKAERGGWALSLSADRSYASLNYRDGNPEDMGRHWREMLAALAELLADPRVAELYQETPRAYAARIVLGVIDAAEGQAAAD